MIPRDASRLTDACQNEEKLNGAYGPVMRKSLHDRLSRGTMYTINTYLWSSNEDVIHSTRSKVSVSSFTETGRTRLKRSLLECERFFFNNESECTFTESNCEFCMNLSNMERALLVLDKRFCWSRSVFDDVNYWIDFKGVLKYCHAKYYV